jgi:hypothetical protein
MTLRHYGAIKHYCNGGYQKAAANNNIAISISPLRSCANVSINKVVDTRRKAASATKKNKSNKLQN